MQYVLHRINHTRDLAEAVARFQEPVGVEMDVRYHEGALVLHHDAFHHASCDAAPDTLDEWLTEYQRLGFAGPLIVNVKSEGIEEACLQLLTKHGVKNWFFLDLSMPYFVRYARLAASGTRPELRPENLAVRFSEFEALEYALGFAHMAGWVWVDCFTKLPLNAEIVTRLHDAGLRICLVSPELQGHSVERIEEFRTLISAEQLQIDAVCSKQPQLWGASFAEAGPREGAGASPVLGGPR